VKLSVKKMSCGGLNRGRSRGKCDRDMRGWRTVIAALGETDSIDIEEKRDDE
jgi:hypothetical protein